MHTSSLEDVQRVHLVGAGGAGMSAIAKLLSQMGKHVTGSDLKFGAALHALEELGLEVWSGSQPERIKDAQLLVCSSAVPDTDAEILRAIQLGIEVWRRPQVLAALTKMIPTIGATGTHGKTTSTAMLTEALRAAGLDPSFVVGGTLVDLGTNAHLGSDDLLVLEADEAFGTFQSLQLTGLMVTNVEDEHMDHYETRYRLDDAFTEVMRNVDGPVLACVDDPGSRKLAERTGAITYGTAPEADWIVTDIVETSESISFTLAGQGKLHPVTVSQPGMHIALDAAGALALLGELGYELGTVLGGLANFRGVARRFEHRGEVAGVTIIDDYAHHPTEVAATLRAARAGEWNRIWAVFQPHLYSRTEALYKEFGHSFAGADHVVITDVFGARETPRPGVTGELVADAAGARTDATVDYVAHRSELAEFLSERVERGDLVLSMGAGDITLLADELAPLLVAR